MEVKVGSEVKFKGQGRYEVIEKLPNSRTKFIIKDIDRGAGYCEQTQKYVGVKSPNGWYLGKNNDFGITLETHKKLLTPYNK
jgi:hypothetical protein